MRFFPVLGLAACMAIPLSTLAAEIVPTERHLQGIPILRQLDDLRCPTEHRLETVVASLIRGGWQRRGTSMPGPVTSGQPTVLTPWVKGSLTLWVQRGSTVCVALITQERRQDE